MNEGLSILKSPEHLDSNIKGAKPIIACVGSFKDFNSFGQNLFDESFIEQQINNAHNIDFFGHPDDFKEKNFLNSGIKTYVFSVLDGQNKFSEGLFDCTGLIVTGIDKETGKNISFLSHQSPNVFLLNKKDDFINHLKSRFVEIKNKCIPGTIDAIVVGGNYFNESDHEELNYGQKYLDSIELLSSETKKILGFEPSIINGPKEDTGPDDIFYDNENRRLYFLRPKVNEDTGSFTQSNIEKEKKKWINGKFNQLGL